MLDPTGLLQARARVLSDARNWLEAFHPDEAAPGTLLEQVERMFVARLTGAPIHADTLRRLHGAHPPDQRLHVVDAVASALRALRLGGADLEVHARAVRELVVPESAPLDGEPVADTDDSPGFDEGPRPSLIRAMHEVSAPRAATRPMVPVTCVLRVRVGSEEGALALVKAAEQAVLSSAVVRLEAASDELVLGSASRRSAGVPHLVRAAQAVLHALPDAHKADARFGLCAVDDALEGGLTRALARAHDVMGRGGLVALDEQAFFDAAVELAEHPRFPRHVDPEAAFGHDRWELSAFLHRPPFLGRDDLVAAVAADLQVNGHDEPTLVLLSGPPGMGKSSLLRRALHRAALDDAKAPVLWGAADPIHPTPYASMVGMVRALAGAPPGSGGSRPKLKRLLEGLAGFLSADDQRELLGLESILAYLMGAGDDDDEEELAAEVDSLSPRALRVAIRRAVLLLVRAMYERAGQRPSVLVVPGAEALDEPTRDLLAFIARRQGPKVVVVLLSTTKLRLPRTFTEAFRVKRHEVGPLSTEDAKRIIDAILDDTTTDDGAGPLLEKARGSPLALHHLTRFAIEGGMLKRDGAWDLDGVKSRSLPGSLDRVLAGRVARLPEDQRRVLGFCAALGHTFWPAAAEVVGVRSGLAREEIGRALNLLLQTGFLTKSNPRPGAPVFPPPGGRSSDPMLAFEHPLLRAAAEDAATPEERAETHALAAEAFETLLPSGTKAAAAALARHLKLAGKKGGALEYLTLAVRRAVRLNDARGAIAMADEGLSLCQEHEVTSRFVFQLEREKALEQAGDREAQKHALKDLVRLAEQTGEARRQGQALFRVARFNLFSGDYDKAEQVALKGLERFRFASDDAGQAQTLRVLALARFERRDLEGATYALSAARELVAFDDHRSLGIVEHQLGMMRLEASDGVGALEHLLAAREHKRVTGDLAGEGAVLDAIADAFLRSGRLHVARAVLGQAVELRARIGDEAGRAESSKNLAEVALLCGDIAAAEELARSAQKLARALGLERLERSAATLAARSQLLGGATQSAEQLIDAVRRRVDEVRDPFAAMEATLVSAEAKVARAQQARGKAARERLLKTALERARSAAALGEAHGYATGQVLGAALVGAVLHEMGDTSSGLLHSQRATELLDDRAITALPAEQVLLIHARILESLGDTEDAQGFIDRARRLLEDRAGRLPEDARERFWSLPARAEVRARAPSGT